MSGDLTLVLQSAEGGKRRDYWSQNLGLAEIVAGLARVADAAGIDSLEPLMAMAVSPDALEMFDDILEALPQLYPDPAERARAYRDILANKLRRKGKPRWSSAAQSRQARDTVAALIAALEASAEDFAAYGSGAKAAVLHDLRAFLGLLDTAVAEGAGFRIE